MSGLKFIFLVFLKREIKQIQAIASLLDRTNKIENLSETEFNDKKLDQNLNGGILNSHL